MQLPPKTILIVDDDADSRTICGVFLRHHGYETEEAGDGAAAVAAATATHPDLILMDVTLPVVDGWDATRRIKGAPETADIPVVILTGHVLEQDRQRAKATGGDGFLPKPCPPHRILEEVQRLIGPAVPT